MKTIQYILFCLISFFVWTPIQANEPAAACLISVEAPQWSNQQVFLCNHFNGRIYKKDSLRIDPTGVGVFTSQEPLVSGLYALLVQGERDFFFDFLLSEQQEFTLVVDTLNFPNTIQARGSSQTQAFFDYSQYLSRKQAERAALFEKKKLTEEADQEPIIQDLESLNTEVEQFIPSFLEQYKGTWVSSFFQGLQQVSGPFPTPTTQEEYDQEVAYVRKHYFDYLPLDDKRYWYTNYFPQKITAYMDYVVEKHPDSLSHAASTLVAAAKSDSLCFQLMVTKLFNHAAESKLMGMENVWAKLAEDYYLKGKTWWSDTTYLATLKTEFKKIEHNRIGMKAPDMVFTDMEGVPLHLYAVPAEYTLLYFFEPSCGHCKTATPKIHNQLYQKYRVKGLEVVCVYTQVDKKEWKQFVDEHKLHDWINVWDPTRQTKFWEYFDVTATPGVYLLDKDKTVIAKKLDEENLDLLLSRLIQ